MCRYLNPSSLDRITKSAALIPLLRFLTLRNSKYRAGCLLLLCERILMLAVFIGQTHLSLLLNRKYLSVDFLPSTSSEANGHSGLSQHFCSLYDWVCSSLYLARPHLSPMRILLWSESGGSRFSGSEGRCVSHYNRWHLTKANQVEG